ncbi:hypothetical protein EGR_06686 [Echinococcus granulosus]|uniref:Uncharacterized protein n=1 Tax=Echinococcus granulosus TaxID=6210 RepID=W6UBM5_ECHGR|nr:hypothetical protein EGR_06686 [Echinococcus granulosus]EUB58505.1 hypothetical protein EGR_06686 [Echinococcus granulosus]
MQKGDGSSERVTKYISTNTYSAETEDVMKQRIDEWLDG